MTKADLVAYEKLSADLLWATVQGHLREEFGDAIYSSWFAPIRVDQVEGEYVRLKVPTRFMRDWILTHYSERIRSLCKMTDPSVRQVSVSVEVTPVVVRHPLSAGAKQLSQPPFPRSSRTFPSTPIKRLCHMATCQLGNVLSCLRSGRQTKNRVAGPCLIATQIPEAVAYHL